MTKRPPIAATLKTCGLALAPSRFHLRRRRRKPRIVVNTRPVT